MFGNTNLKDMNLKAHRRKIGLVTQDPVLFSGTIKDNITYGVDPKPPMEEVINAAQVANAHTFIESFPNKYDEQVGERGTSLSGGQKQVRYRTDQFTALYLFLRLFWLRVSSGLRLLEP